ncbi:MAG: hypothetical protein E7167_01375 [Firmicutes bacterium]|nr:hypothetical protein [Bacillota bacterium]
MKLNKVYEVSIHELCEEMGIEPWDLPWRDGYDNSEYFDDMTLHCDNESYQWYLERDEKMFNDPESDPEEYRRFINMLDVIKHLRNNYGVYCDVIVGEF